MKRKRAMNYRKAIEKIEDLICTSKDSYFSNTYMNTYSVRDILEERWSELRTISFENDDSVIDFTLNLVIMSMEQPISKIYNIIKKKDSIRHKKEAFTLSMLLLEDVLISGYTPIISYNILTDDYVIDNYVDILLDNSIHSDEEFNRPEHYEWSRDILIDIIRHHKEILEVISGWADFGILIEWTNKFPDFAEVKEFEELEKDLRFADCSIMRIKILNTSEGEGYE